MVGGGRRFLEDPAKIVVNPSTRRKTLFLTIIANSNSEFLAPFTLTDGDNGNCPNLTNPLPRLGSGWREGQENGGCRTMISGRSAEIAVNPSTRQTALFVTIIANSSSEFLAPYTPTDGGNGNWQNLIHSLPRLGVWMTGQENDGRRAVISGRSCQNRGQSIDSTEDPLFNPNRE